MGLEVDHRATDGTTPLFNAAQWNQELMVAFLIEQKVCFLFSYYCLCCVLNYFVVFVFVF